MSSSSTASYYCLNPLCKKEERFDSNTCPDCNYDTSLDGYKGIEFLLSKNENKLIIKIQKAITTPLDPHYFTLKIIKESELPDLNDTSHIIDEFKNKTKSLETAEIIHISTIYYSADKQNSNLPKTKYFYIITEFIEPSKNIDCLKDKIRDNYTKEFLSLLQSLNSLHAANIIHGKIKKENIFHHNNSYKLIDVYPRKSLIDYQKLKEKDLQDLGKMYSDLFTLNEGNILGKNTKIKNLTREIASMDKAGEIRTAKAAIKYLQPNYIYYPSKAWKYSWNLFQFIIKQIEDVYKAGKNSFFMLVLLLLSILGIGAIIFGKNPLEVIPRIYHFAQEVFSKKEGEQKYQTNGDYNDRDFNNSLKEIQVELNKHNLVAADTKTRQLMLQVFKKRMNINNTNVIADMIQIDFEKSQNSNGVTSIGENQIISPIQKRRVQEIDRVWFHGTNGKHGFYQQQTVYQRSTSDPNCRVKNDHERETAHVDATFENLGWGFRGCKKIDPIPDQIDKIMMSSESWNLKRQKIQAKFKENGGVNDNENVPDGYYPITAGLVANQQFPQFAKWCGYTKEDLEAKNNN